MSTLTIQSSSLEETLSLGRQIGVLLKPGDLILLSAPYGAGKTWLTKGLAAGLGVDDPDEVNSPTYVIMNRYSGRVPVCHIDCTRLESQDELESLGISEALTGGVVVLEWANLVQPFLATAQFRVLEIRISITGEETREFGLHSDDFDFRLMACRKMPPAEK